ncbi:hypothetical protein QBC32DRAFT_350558 [Pseudoneurospora amorphoporcata]|uniref:2EXR domain-containing protein n=1 Tax=Pseudoneurospora amorphoporcata TaxID=241081 RepID=A0AAN6NPP0_9PEZI|nr:hypothetical protein QBC32DRAFT_350558 [Pseudoneurospora amorphoporcata]
MRAHKMTTRSLSTTQKQQPRSHRGRSKSNQPNQNSEETFSKFPSFPSEIRLMVWEEFLNDYEDNPPVAWTLIWGVCDPKDFPDPTNIRLRPYIYIERHCQNDLLVEYNSNPLLKVSHEARIAALHNQRYVSIRVWDLDINIIVRPAMDYFYVDTLACCKMFRGDFLPGLTAEYGNPTVFTLAEDMSFVKHAFVQPFTFCEISDDGRHFDIHKNASATACTWCALDKLFNNHLNTASTVVSHFITEEPYDDEAMAWEAMLDFRSELFSGSRLWPVWAYYSHYYQDSMLMYDPDTTDMSFEAKYRRSCMDCWGWICEVFKRHQALQLADYEYLAYSGDWVHVGEPQLDTRKRGKVDPGRVWVDVYDSFKLARKRRVKRCRRGPIRVLKHGRTLPSEVSGFSLRHQQPSEVVELRTTCGTRCDDGVHVYPVKDGQLDLDNLDHEVGGDKEGSDAWLNWKWAGQGTWDGTSDDDHDEDNDDAGSSGEESLYSVFDMSEGSLGELTD